MGITEKISELEKEYSRTQKNKATEHHLGLLKAKLAMLKREIVSGKGKAGKPSGGFDVKKTGNATVVFIGLPSVGKSSLLNVLTGNRAKTASYAFTTLTCIPGMMEYRGSRIQILDLPGIISGAKEGRGRGREVLAVARNADLVLLTLDVFDPLYREKLVEELEGIGIRLDQESPHVVVTPLFKGGQNIAFTVKQTKGLNEKLVAAILNEYSIHNANVIIRENITVDQFIDVLVGNRKYMPSVTIINKVDLVKPEFLKSLPFDFVPVSAEKNLGIKELKEAIYNSLQLIQVYTKRVNEKVDLREPLMVRKGSTIGDACEKIHKDLKENFDFAQIWGPSAKFPGQKGGLDHVLKDGDIFCVHKKNFA